MRKTKKKSFFSRWWVQKSFFYSDCRGGDDQTLAKNHRVFIRTR